MTSSVAASQPILDNSTDAVIVGYQWIRSDGGKEPRQSVTINAAGQGVTDTWTLGTNGQQLAASQSNHPRGSLVASLAWCAVLIVGAWYPLEAQAALPAPSRPVTSVTVTVNTYSYGGPCPAKLTFTGTITTDVVPTVPITYQWIRSDKTKGPRRTIRMTSTTATVT